MRRSVAILTTGRQDFSILRSTCLALRADPRFTLSLWSGGMHESAQFGDTASDLVRAGLVLDERLAWPTADDASLATQAACALEQVAGAIQRRRPGLLMLVGDRIETAAAAIAATASLTPVVHIHGGEETEGAIDNALRHAITKMSHLHLVSHEDHAARVRQMGEDPGSVFVVGAPGLDALHRTDLPDRAALASSLGIALDPPILIVTLHPATLGEHDDAEAARAVTGALSNLNATCIITLPNADTGNAAIREQFLTLRGLPRRVVVGALGADRFTALLRIADAVVGNSSSGLIEAPAVGVPAVNIGPRQRGRLRGENVIDCGVSSEEILEAVREALSPEVRARARAGGSPYGDGRSAARIVELLAAWTPPNPPVKRFFEARGTASKQVGND